MSSEIKSIKIILLFFLIWRIGLFFVAFISPQIIPIFGDRFPYWQERLISSNLPQFIWSLGNFDGVHYLGIAKDGYAYQFTQAFFPLYPILIRFGSIATNGNLLLSAILISNVTFLFALTIFYKLVSQLYNQKVALWSAIFLLTFPTSFFFGSVYTEGLFFLMIISSFYLIEKNKILAASIIGSFASATRLIGLFLTPAFLVSQPKRNILPSLLVPLGFLAYVAYLQLEFNNPLYFLTSQSIFGQERSTTEIVLLPQVFWRYFKILATTNGLPFFNAAFELFSTTFALFMLSLAYIKRIKISWLVFSFLAIITPTLTGTLTSMPRYILIAFPIYVVLAITLSQPLKIIFVLISTILLIITTMLFTQGYWVA